MLRMTFYIRGQGAGADAFFLGKKFSKIKVCFGLPPPAPCPLIHKQPVFMSFVIYIRIKMSILNR